MKSRFQPDGITWLQIHGLEDTDAVQTVCTHFGIDFLVMQDISIPTMPARSRSTISTM